MRNKENSSRPVTSSKNYLGISAHRTDRLDNNSGGRFSPQAQHDYTKLKSKTSSQGSLIRENSWDSKVTVQDCDMVTGANTTLHTVPEFLTGRPMESQELLQNPETTHSESQDPTQPVPGTSILNITTDPINRLADILVGINNRPSTQTLTVRPVSSTTATFDGKLEKFELFEDRFHTMIKVQPKLTKAMKINHFHSFTQKRVTNISQHQLDQQTNIR